MPMKGFQGSFHPTIMALLFFIMVLGVSQATLLHGWGPIGDPCNRSTANTYTKEWETTHGSVLCDTYHTFMNGLHQPHYMVMYKGAMQYPLGLMGRNWLDASVHALSIHVTVLLQYEVRGGHLVQNPYRYYDIDKDRCNMETQLVRIFDPCSYPNDATHIRFVNTYPGSEELTCVPRWAVTKEAVYYSKLAFELAQMQDHILLRVRYGAQDIGEHTLDTPWGNDIQDGIHVMTFDLNLHFVHHWQQIFHGEGWSEVGELRGDLYMRLRVRMHPSLWAFHNTNSTITTTSPYTLVGSVHAMNTSSDIRDARYRYMPLSYANGICCWDSPKSARAAYWTVSVDWLSQSPNVTSLGPVAMAVGATVVGHWQPTDPNNVFYNPDTTTTPPTTLALLRGSLGVAIETWLAKFTRSVDLSACVKTCDPRVGCMGYVDTTSYATGCVLGDPKGKLGWYNYRPNVVLHYPVPFTGNITTWRQYNILTIKQVCDVLTTDAKVRDSGIPYISDTNIMPGVNTTYNPCEPIRRGCDGRLWGPTYTKEGRCGPSRARRSIAIA